MVIICSATMESKALYSNVIRNIFSINSSGKILKCALKGLNAKNEVTLKQKICAIQKSTNKLINATLSTLKRCNTLVQSESHKKQFAKLLQTFVEATAIYHNIQKKVANKIKCLVSPQEFSELFDLCNKNEINDAKLKEMLVDLLQQNQIVHNETSDLMLKGGYSKLFGLFMIAVILIIVCLTTFIST